MMICFLFMVNYALLLDISILCQGIKFVCGTSTYRAGAINLLLVVIQCILI